MIPSIIAKINEPDDNLFQPYNWWSTIFSIALILGVVIATGYDTVQNYSVAITAYTAVGLVLSTTAVNQLIYSSIAAREAAAAGFLLLSMVFVCASKQYTKLTVRQRLLTQLARLFGSSTTVPPLPQHHTLLLIHSLYRKNLR